MAAIVHGTYRTETSEGFVADFCPVCRDVQAFRLIRVGDASHLFYISFGHGRLAGRVVRCVDCNVARLHEESRYSGVAKESGDKEALIAMTHPKVRATFAERLALEEKLRANPESLSSAQRLDLLAEPFHELNSELEQLDKGTAHQKSAKMWGMLALMAVTGVLGGIFRFEESKMFWVMGGAAAAFIVTWAGILITAEVRGIKERIIPSLVRALRPLRPTREELQRIVEDCRAAGMRAGKKINPATLWAAVQ